MLGANRVVVGERCPAIDKRLLGSTFDVKILLHFLPGSLAEAKSKVDTCAALIRVADVTSGPGTHSAFEDARAHDSHRLLI